jgi:hypothetical protein
MRHVCNHSIWKIWIIIEDNQVVPSIKTTKMLPRRERRNGKERKRRQYPLHIRVRIQTTILIIDIFNARSYIHN